MEFELGQTYSGYKFLDVVRRSRHAVQYRVQNTLAQRVECLRALTGAAADDPDAAETFLREVRIRARLSHPHIVMFYTAVPIEGRMAMTTELPDSLSLAERLNLGPIPWREALHIAHQLLDALACMHQQSFVHCDITPENILFGPGGCCKLAGFSLARPIDPVHKSVSGTIVGNPRYISPEQVKGESPLDPRSDLYSLGVVLYEMLTGSPPFESRSQFELMMAHVSQAPAPPSHRQATLPQFLDDVVLKALAKDAAGRYPSAAAFADAVARVAGQTSVEPEAPAAPAPLAPEPTVAPPPQVAAVPAEAVAAAACATVPEPAPRTEPAHGDVPGPEAAPLTVGVVAEAALQTPALDPEREANPEPAAVIAEVAAPAPEAVTAAAAEALAETTAPAAAIVPEPEAAAAPEAVTVAPEAVSETAAPASAIPEVEATPEPAAVNSENPAPALVLVSAPMPQHTGDKKL